MHTRSSLNTYQRSDVGVGLLVQKKLRDSVVATVSCNVQCREVVQRDVVNRRLMLQQQLHAFYVVPLGWHVQRGQSILVEEKKKNDIRYLFHDGECDCFILRSLTLVLAKIGAPRSNRISTAWSCPLLAAQCSGVSPSWQTQTNLNSQGYPIQRKRCCDDMKADSHPGFGIYLSTSVQQQGHHIGVAPLGGHMERCDPILTREKISLGSHHI